MTSLPHVSVFLDDVKKYLTFLLTRLLSALQFVCICLERVTAVISTRDLLLSMPAIIGLLQPKKLGQGVERLQASVLPSGRHLIWSIE